jgi:hypothetical protein
MDAPAVVHDLGIYELWGLFADTFWALDPCPDDGVVWYFSGYGLATLVTT